MIESISKENFFSFQIHFSNKFFEHKIDNTNKNLLSSLINLDNLLSTNDRKNVLTNF